MYEFAVRVMRKKLKSSADGDDCGSKKCKRGYGGASGGVWWSLRLAQIWSRSIGFVSVHWAGMWLQSPLRCFHILFSL
jgi:hypothetical protein